MFFSTLLFGLVLGGTYALVALGLTLQYGISRIMNLAYGDLLIAAAFLTMLGFTSYSVLPPIAMLLIVPLGFVFSYLLYLFVLRPLVRRAENRAALEIDSILATFGLLFVMQGVMLLIFGGNIFGYSWLDNAVDLFGVRIATNRLLALALAILLALGLYLVVTRTRLGLALQAVANRPESAPLVGINVEQVAAYAFALGGAMAAAGGVAFSMIQTFTATSGTALTLKALVIVIMGGVGNLPGALMAGFALGITETFVAAFIDPGLTLAATYGIFLLVLLIRPNGLFGKAAG
ncbi:branched-chain amino acid ABC transporter permease [Notoacmeibacter sp. MSK16QG-6]|uniref:branched-chain amino acid ABC transporter permease n=1 Tax=Notoacmeibacter sp. MSK16QG-6 TaxID=2957982 RepID=UPI0020A0EEF3|nr:branched-chain amino acid ABC transporter permease [Notoacmeibacter sp. MSK16QG-6]MCP1199525.1 branched-chain amino acid ABC transporter permease [Notoacmeibacter sp. MSK16QG-6]